VDLPAFPDTKLAKYVAKYSYMLLFIDLYSPLFVSDMFVFCVNVADAVYLVQIIKV